MAVNTNSEVFANPIRNVRKPWIFGYSKSPITMAKNYMKLTIGLDIWLNIVVGDRCPWSNIYVTLRPHPLLGENNAVI